MGEVRPGAPSEKIARKLVGLSDGLQVQWLCSRADGGADVDMREVMAGMVADVRIAGSFVRERGRGCRRG